MKEVAPASPCDWKRIGKNMLRFRSFVATCVVRNRVSAPLRLKPWLVKRGPSNIVHGCRSKTDFAIPIFSNVFRMHEFDASLHDNYLRKSYDADRIHSCMIGHIGLDAHRRLYDSIIISLSSGYLTRRFKREF
ncbi:hypothetical protein NPIL_493141 [Nephila pilipes]|uniref:Uncharacterized protein n=1 Tax=Nephila pilipes TaxID=299642 RepID=A0A8X6TNK6_NEPPI|nr:hypothetical protein NPIL_493141 [Nephila pilipes]